MKRKKMHALSVSGWAGFMIPIALLIMGIPILKTITPYDERRSAENLSLSSEEEFTPEISVPPAELELAIKQTELKIEREILRDHEAKLRREIASEQLGERNGLYGLGPESRALEAKLAALEAELAALEAELAAPQREPENESEQALVQRFFETLDKGKLFHNVPQTMQVNVDSKIEAGISKRVTDKLLQRLEIEGDVTIESKPVQYNPLGTELILWASDDAFSVSPIENGRKTIFPGDEQLWSWWIKPLKAGNHPIVIKAVVEFQPQGSTQTYRREFISFEEYRIVRGNTRYSLQQLLQDNFGELVGVIVGSGIFGSLSGWWFASRQAKAKSQYSIGFLSDSHTS